MVIDDLDFVRVGSTPDETDPPLIVDPDAVLAFAVATKLLEPIPRRRAKIDERLCGVQDQELTQRESNNVRRQTPGALTLEDSFRLRVPKAPDHLRG
jgi:hypothetical protein